MQYGSDCKTRLSRLLKLLKQLWKCLNPIRQFDMPLKKSKNHNIIKLYELSGDTWRWLCFESFKIIYIIKAIVNPGWNPIRQFDEHHKKVKNYNLIG